MCCTFWTSLQCFTKCRMTSKRTRTDTITTRCMIFFQKCVLTCEREQPFKHKKSTFFIKKSYPDVGCNSGSNSCTFLFILQPKCCETWINSFFKKKRPTTRSIFNSYSDQRLSETNLYYSLDLLLFHQTLSHSIQNNHFISCPPLLKQLPPHLPIACNMKLLLIYSNTCTIQ